MHPAPSIILFTSLSGLGFGLLIWLGLGAPDVEGWSAFFAFGLAYGLSIVGLVASTLHLGHPERALKAFSQWRSSWLSREGVVSVGALLVLAPFAFGRVFLGIDLAILGWIGAGLSLLTVLCTSMIYAQLKTVPRWNMALVPPLFMLFSIGGSGILVMERWGLVVMLVVLTVLQVAYWLLGDRKFAQAGHTHGNRNRAGPDRLRPLARKPAYGDKLPAQGNGLFRGPQAPATLARDRSWFWLVWCLRWLLWWCRI